MVNYRKVPVEHMAGGVKRYIEQGIPPGPFLSALFSNDLKGAYSCADEFNAAAMHSWVIFMVSEMPIDSQGSPEAMALWIAQGGLGLDPTDPATLE